MMKTILNRLLLTLVLCSVTFSCDNDEPTVEQYTEEFAKTDLIDFSKLQSEDISFDQLLTKLNNPTLDKGILSKIDFGTNSNENITNRITDTLLIVDTNTIFFAQYDNYNYTTFPIVEDLDNDSFRNLIIENIDGDHPVARIITYTPDETWLYSDHTLTEYAGDVTMESFSGEWQVSTQRGDVCFIASIPNWGCAWQSNSGHEPGYPGCNGGNFITGYSAGEVCYDSANLEGNGSGGGDGEGSGGSGSGSSDGDDLPIITKPVERCLQSDVDPAICECMADGSTIQECLEEEEFEENISINNIENDCAKGMIENNLIGTSVGVYTNFLNDIRNTFFGDPNVTLFFRDDEDVQETANAATDFDSQEAIDSGTYNIIITLSEDYLNNNPTKLSVAMIIIHELVHAKLIYSYLNGTLLEEYPQYSDLKDSFDNYIENRTPENGLSVNDESHEVMVDFIGQMSYALFKYAEKVGMDNVTQEYCTNIVKGSFYDTPAMSEIDTGDFTAEELLEMTFNEQENNENALGDDC